MTTRAHDATHRDSLYLPFLGGFYDHVAQPLAWAGLRLATGLMLVYLAWPKILAPLSQSGFLDSIGFHPGWLFSPLLAATQFFGGIAIAIGFLTRPMALANAVVLLITLWFHLSHPYGASFLTPAGVELLKGEGAANFTPPALMFLADGGGRFLAQVQDKADLLSLLWTGAAAFFAAHGGGSWSIDRALMKKEF
jgi:putative oxidoreductase